MVTTVAGYDEKLYYQEDIKYLVARLWQWRLVGDFHPTGTFSNDWYALQHRDDGWWIVAFPGCGWDGATWFPDFDWVMQGSLGHDILHWLIAKGVIPESENHLIDEEMGHIIRARATVPKLGGESLLALRSWYVQKGIGLIDQKAGVPVHPIMVV